jgi:putative PIN family toxin of toxin-antitoxin system
VLDTNTAVSGLIWGGVPGQLIDAAAAGRVQLIASLPLLDELHGVLFREKFAGQLAEQDKTALGSRTGGRKRTTTMLTK